MYVYIYIYIHTYVYTYIHTCIYLSVAPDTENIILGTLRWLKRQNGHRKHTKKKRNAELVKR